MKLSKLTPATEYEVNDWLIKSLDLTPYQKEKLRENEVVRFSSFHFYKPIKKEKTSLLWRLTLIVFPIYLVILTIFYIFYWIITGHQGLNENYLQKFHYKWINKLNF